MGEGAQLVETARLVPARNQRFFFHDLTLPVHSGLDYFLLDSLSLFIIL
jgi:hypothetical protein